MSTTSLTAEALYRHHRFTDPLPIPHFVNLTHESAPHCRVTLKNADLRLHSLLPPTPLWTYDGYFPGPVIEVRRDAHVTVEWANALTGTIPIDVMSSAEGDANDPSQNAAGGKPRDGSGGVPADPYYEKAKRLTPWIVTHLHGGRTESDSDGWAENMVPHGRSRIAHYDTSLPPRQHAPMLWFHDHAMGVTRLNVYAGLAGLWLIRDDADAAIRHALKAAHAGTSDHDGATPWEIPIVIADRNLQTTDGAPTSPLTERLLHKVNDSPSPGADGAWNDRGPMEFFGPFTVLNGAIWPHCTVKTRPYRLRIVNGSNARTYQLVLATVTQDDSGQETLTPVVTPGVLYQIGSDGGLFAHPTDLPAANTQQIGDYRVLTLAPAERADLILDVSGLQPGTRLRWVNVAPAPFGGEAPSGPLGAPDLAGRNPYPEIMEFRVEAGGGAGHPLALPMPLCDYAPPPQHNQLGDHEHRLIVLAEQADPTDDPPPGVLESDWKRTTTLSLREMELIGFVDAIPPGHETDGIPLAVGPRQAGEVDIDFFVEALPNDPAEVKHHRCRYRTVASMFRDTVNFIVRSGGKEIWNILNITGDVHPFHVHLVQFQLFGSNNGRDGGFAMASDLYPPDHVPGPLLEYVSAPTVTDTNELGWKDTIRVNPGELTRILATFDGHAGRYMYHCHILEHEDHEMMRPFVVQPGEIMDFMPSMGGMAAMSGMPSMGGVTVLSGVRRARADRAFGSARATGGAPAVGHPDSGASPAPKTP